jgi:hypothetical protein
LSRFAHRNPGGGNPRHLVGGGAALPPF